MFIKLFLRILLDASKERFFQNKFRWLVLTIKYFYCSLSFSLLMLQKLRFHKYTILQFQQLFCINCWLEIDSCHQRYYRAGFYNGSLCNVFAATYILLASSYVHQLLIPFYYVRSYFLLYFLPVSSYSILSTSYF